MQGRFLTYHSYTGKNKNTKVQNSLSINYAAVMIGTEGCKRKKLQKPQQAIQIC
jgi:hypothetical protein